MNAGDLGIRGRHHAVNVDRPVRHYLYRLGPGVGERRYRRRRGLLAVSVVQKEALATRLELTPSTRRPLAASVTGLRSKRGVFAGAT